MASKGSKVGGTKSSFVVAGLFAIGAVVSSAFLSGLSPITSAEVTFSDNSASGLEIIPASCPSYAHYLGECSEIGFNGVGSASTCTPLDFCSGSDQLHRDINCNATLVQHCSFGCRGTATPPPSAEEDGGFVGGTTSLCLSQCQDYNYCIGNNVYHSTASCNNTQLKACPYGCLDGECLAANACGPTNICKGSDLFTNADEDGKVSSCEYRLLKHCSFGCVGQACRATPALLGASQHLTAKPNIVKKGDTTRLFWTIDNAESCSVTGTNGDSWHVDTSGESGIVSGPIKSQTVYTLSCVGVDASAPPSMSESTIVNVVPVFLER